MAQSTKENIKFKILKALDVSGFTAFDPIIRLIFGEEPRKQLDAIFKYLVVPTVFVIFCLGGWWWIGPRHKTKSGEVPTPDVVWDSVQINNTIAWREKIKQEDFQLSGEVRMARLAEVKEQYAVLEIKAAEARQAVTDAEKARAQIEAEAIAPLQEQYTALRAEGKEAADARDEEIQTLAEEVSQGAVDKSVLLAAIRQDAVAQDAEREALKGLKERIDQARSLKYEPLIAARKRSDSLADELLFLKTRLEFLESRNLSLKLEEAEVEHDGLLSDLDRAETPKAALATAKKAVRAEEGIERMQSQDYASAVTIYQQIKRSLFTVFCGFFMAAAVAIPIGIMCGLNRIFMACMTPIISVFKPVSPVVWLLIFQIVVGAFFPDPENHPLFLFFKNTPVFSSLNINPALVFSACTVAMCAVWPALVNTALGVASIDKDHINVARVLRLGFWDRLVKIVIPSALPLVFAGLRISLGVGWMVLIAAEALSSSDGLGKFVWDEYQNGSSLTFANIIMVCFVVGIIGFFLDRMMVVFQRLVSFDGAPTAV